MTPTWLSSPDWAGAVRALLHTLWQGAIFAIALTIVFRQANRPALRYRFAVAALIGITLVGIVTWAVIVNPGSEPVQPLAESTHVTTMAVNNTSSGGVTSVQSAAQPHVDNINFNWTAWLAACWVCGAAGMIIRAGFQLAGAGRLRRTSKAVTDAPALALLTEALRISGVSRTVRLAVTEKLTSPAIVGFLVPTLVLPLSLFTTLTPDQLRFIFLHELAHVRRGDYLAHVFQLLVEAVLFFNPAVWWISRQIRVEREACCDAMAIELSQAPAEYARTLVQVAETLVHRTPAAAMAFGEEKKSSSLTDRVKRMLIPGYRPALRLTWRAMMLSLTIGAGLLFFSAIGVRWTVAAILSPQERIARIETKMKEYGLSPIPPDYSRNDGTGPKAICSGTIRTWDNSPMPKFTYLEALTVVGNNSSADSILVKDGVFNDNIPSGQIFLGLQLSNYAPTMIGPLNGYETNRFDHLEFVLQRGFDLPVQLIDSESEKPVPAAVLSTMFWMNNEGFPENRWKGSNGVAILNHCADLPLRIIINAPGYQITQQRLSSIQEGQPLKIYLKPGAATSGVVVDEISGSLIAGAQFHLLYHSEADGGAFAWDDDLHVLGKSDANGKFEIDQLAAVGHYYYIGLSAPSHGSIVVTNLVPGEKNIILKLGPELIVHGHVLGDLNRLEKRDGKPGLFGTRADRYDDNSYGSGLWIPVRIRNHVGTFVFTNPVSGPFTLTGEERDVRAPISDWVVNLSKPEKAAPTREVIFRFRSRSGVPPRGTVWVEGGPRRADMTIINGEVRFPATIGAYASVSPKEMVGYWFDERMNNDGVNTNLVSAGSGPLIIDVPVFPAGAIYAKAENADGAAAGRVLFGFSQIKRGPDESPMTFLDQSDGFSDESPRTWFSGALPLGGIYRVHCWRDNAFAVSEPVHLTEEKPDADVVLQFAPGQAIHGVIQQPNGQPLRDSAVEVSFSLKDGGGFNLPSVSTDHEGKFEIDGTTPALGDYIVTVTAPGIAVERVKLRAHKSAQVIRLRKGRILAGQVLERSTGFAIPNVKIRAWCEEGEKYPAAETQTDSDGHFAFTTLGNTSYRFYIADAQEFPDRTYAANGTTNLEFRVKLIPGTSVKPVPPRAAR